MTWRQRTYRLLSVDWHELTLQVQDLGTEQITVLPMQHLWSLSQVLLPEQKNAEIAEFVTATNLPESFLSKANRVVWIVEKTRQQLAMAERQAYLQSIPFRYTPMLKEILSTLDEPVGLTTYYKYRKLYERYDGDRIRIAASFRRSSFNQTQMSAAQLHIVDEVILRYGTRQPPRRPRILYNILRSTLERTLFHWIDPNYCHEEIPQALVDELFDHHIPIATILNHPEKSTWLVPIRLPSESWFYTYWRWFAAQPEQGKSVFVSRYGDDGWENEMLVFDSFVHQASMPLQYVFADHWLVDVFTVDEATRQRRERLWMTALIDAYSRCILGMVLLYEEPSIWSIQTALQHAIWMKTSHENLGIDGTWACFGIPQQLFLDNAWAHHSYSLEDLARSISQNGRYPSIDLVFRPPYKGRYGALIERYFGHLSSRMKAELPGAIASSHPREVGRAANDACLLYEDIDRFLHQEILAHVHKPRQELNGATPHEKWQSWLEKTIPQVPIPTPELQRLFWRMHHQTRVITRSGINAFGMQYTAPELRQAERINRQGKPIFYSFRYDPADISRLALFRDGYWVCDVYAKQLRQADGSYQPLSLSERKLARVLAQDDGRNARDWLRYINDNEALYIQRRAEQRRATRPTKRVEKQVSDTQEMTQALEYLKPEERDQELTNLLNDFLRKS